MWPPFFFGTIPTYGVLPYAMIIHDVILQANTPTLHVTSKFGPEYWAVNLCEGSYVA